MSFTITGQDTGYLSLRDQHIAIRTEAPLFKEEEVYERQSRVVWTDSTVRVHVGYETVCEPVYSQNDDLWEEPELVGYKSVQKPVYELQRQRVPRREEFTTRSLRNVATVTAGKIQANASELFGLLNASMLIKLKTTNPLATRIKRALIEHAIISVGSGKYCPSPTQARVTAAAFASKRRREKAHTERNRFEFIGSSEGTRADAIREADRSRTALMDRAVPSESIDGRLLLTDAPASPALAASTPPTSPSAAEAS
ncbi:MAG: hypothetical protein SP1CHLAM54_18180 [Chlamydiia bacterium]|nr:hypothetical protein [Chlamydiia bacterium]MCH9616704.1 hypothetical protein [Chlamydiia bacterium]MCH9629435.1 hypothetical protein [Chlamydiia bacterium]